MILCGYATPVEGCSETGSLTQDGPLRSRSRCPMGNAQSSAIGTRSSAGPRSTQRNGAPSTRTARASTSYLVTRYLRQLRVKASGDRKRRPKRSRASVGLGKQTNRHRPLTSVLSVKCQVSNKLC